MTIDKYILIRWPLKAARYSSPKKAKIIIVTILIFVSMYNVPHLFITAVVKGNCYGYSTKVSLLKFIPGPLCTKWGNSFYIVNPYELCHC